MKKVMVFITAILFFMPFSSVAATINVPGDQPNIQAAIDAAVDGDIVLLADGTYNGTGNYNINFNGKAITVRSANGPDNCIIDCQQQGRGFWFYNGETKTSVLDGLTIRNGYAESGDGGGVYSEESPTINNCVFENNIAVNDGGAACGAFFTNCTFTGNSATNGGAACGSSFTNCTFTGNSAISDGGAVYNSVSFTDCTFTDNSATSDGGAVYATPFALFTNCTFTGNSATYGGAVNVTNDESYSPGIYGMSYDSTFTDCTFTDNSATSDGGAVYVTCTSSKSGSMFTFTDCTFTDNSATSDGGAVYVNDSSYYGPSLTNCTFSGNRASDGGAIYVPDGSLSSFTNCTFSGNSATYGGAVYATSFTYSDCIFTDNSATYGGAVYANSTSPFTNCTFSGNRASDGGAVYGSYFTFTDCTFTGNSATSDGGAVYDYYYGSSFTNCTFTGNSASDGGTVYFSPPLSLSSFFTNCTFVLNEATGQGGTIWCSIPFVPEDPITIKNCIFWGNTAPQGAQVYEEEKTLLMTYSDIQDGHFGTGNINLDPMFVDPLNGDVHIFYGSPCIDAGTADGAPSTDIDGNPRPAGSGFDMGAYEYQISSQCRADNLEACETEGKRLVKYTF